jgi:hypothetical protein
MLRIYFLQQWFNRKRQRKHTVDELTPRPVKIETSRSYIESRRAA